MNNVSKRGRMGNLAQPGDGNSTQPTASTVAWKTTLEAVSHNKPTELAIILHAFPGVIDVRVVKSERIFTVTDMVGGDSDAK